MNAEPNHELSIIYLKKQAEYTTQFLVSPSQEDVFIDFSSGPIDGDNQKRELPIHTRIALPWSAVERLSKILNEIVEQRHNSSSSVSENSPQIPVASLPGRKR